MSKRRNELLVLGIITLLAIGLTGCSTQAPVAEDPAEVAFARRDIKVYESPT